MKQTIGMERSFFLGDYKILKVSDIITEIPEELINNKEVQSLLRMLQMIRLDKSHVAYRLHASKVYGLEYEDALALLNDLEMDTIKTLKEILEDGEIKAEIELEKLEV